MKVLVVDDDVLLTDMVKTMLDEVGIDAVVANTFEDAMLAIDEVGPDFVLTDIDLRGRTGFEIAEVCRARSIPVAMMSGHDHDYLERLYPPLVGSEARWLAKPFGVEDLLRAVSDWTRS